MTGPVLLCYDGSTQAADAIRGASAVLAGRDALVLSVAVPAADEMPLNPGGDLVGRISGLYADWDELALTVAERHAIRGCEVAAEAGFTARALTATGKPAATIMRISDDHDASVIVLGATHHGALGGLLGSVSTRVVQLCRRPVLVISGS